MYNPQNPNHTTLYAQALYVKLQKLSEDIQLQHSIINAQKETVLKSRQRIYYENQKSPPLGSPTHAIHAHADTVVQHRAMVIKHYELIQQHKQMVKEQGIHVQNLTSALLNIQQETNVVDELMNTRMAETRRPTITSPSVNYNSSINNNTTVIPTLVSPSSPDIRVREIRKGQSKRQQTQDDLKDLNDLNDFTMEDAETNTKIKVTDIVDEDNNTIHLSITSESANQNEKDEITSITLTTTSTSTSTTPNSTSRLTTTVSSVSTPTITTTTATTTTTTTFNPPSSENYGEISPYQENSVPLPLSP